MAITLLLLLVVLTTSKFQASMWISEVNKTVFTSK